MTDEELFNALDGLFAGEDQTNGIKDDDLLEQVDLELERSDSIERLTKFLREHYYKAPYTVEDVARFIRFLARQLDFDL